MTDTKVAAGRPTAYWVPVTRIDGSTRVEMRWTLEPAVESADTAPSTPATVRRAA